MGKTGNKRKGRSDGKVMGRTESEGTNELQVMGKRRGRRVSEQRVKGNDGKE